MVFWLIPPTDENLAKYKDWLLSNQKSESFFGDQVEHCCRIELKADQTLFVPSAWICAYFASKDFIYSYKLIVF